MLHFSNCRYYDGLNAKSYLVEVTATEDALYLKNLEDGSNFIWPTLLIEILAEPIGARTGLCLNRDNPNARLVLNPDLFDYLKPKLVHSSHHLIFNKLTYSIMLATVVLLVSFYYIMSNASILIENYMPLSIESSLGNYTENMLFLSSKNKIVENKTLNKIVTHLSQNINLEHPIKIYIIDTEDPPNALALPNRNIYVYNSLIQSVTSSDELIGVIAHEMAHIIKHHSTINYIRYLGLFFIIKSSIGLKDTTNVTELLLNPYSHETEIEADTIAADILYKSKISSEGLRSLFDKTTDEEKDSTFLRFLSTHPSSEIRLKNLQSLPTVRKTKPFLTDKEWLELKRMRE